MLRVLEPEYVYGASLMGAGGGGFMLLLCKRTSTHGVSGPVCVFVTSRRAPVARLTVELLCLAASAACVACHADSHGCGDNQPGSMVAATSTLRPLPLAGVGACGVH